MNSKLLFVFALISSIVLHAYILQAMKMKQTVVSVKPQKKVSPIINLQHVSVKEVVPELPVAVPVVEELPPKVITKKTLKRVVKKKKVVEKLVTKKSIKKKKRKKVSKAPSKSKLSAPKRKVIKNAYLAKVRRIIEQRKRYPTSAKRMKQQGTAYVKFTISRNGKINHIVLEKKCPFSKLNKAALKIFKSIGAFAPIPKDIDAEYLSLTIPITYKILN